MIINIVTQIVSNVIDHGMNAQEATNVPRIHHQHSPDVVRLERGVGEDRKRALEDKGHQCVWFRAMGSASTVVVRETGSSLLFEGAADPRRSLPGSASGLGHCKL